jgi:hypothetical protein
VSDSGEGDRRPPSPWTRRGLIVAGLGAASGALVASSPELPLVEPRRRAVTADSVADAVGVCIHSGWRDTVYGDADRLRSALGDLGVRHVREDRTVGDEIQADTVRRIARATGIRWTFLTGSPTSEHTVEQYLADLSTELAPVIEALEGVNEWDQAGRPDWVAELRTRQERLWKASRGDRRLRSLPVLAPSVDGAVATQVGDLSRWCDLGNGHCYPNPAPPSAVQTNLARQVGAIAGSGKPVWFTETGYQNALGGSRDQWAQPISEEAVGIYQPRIVLENLLRGIPRAYTYELLDHAPDPERTDPELNYGLIRNDWTPKPSYVALQNLLALVDDPGPGRRPDRLDHTLTGGTPDLRQLLTQRRDGTFVLFLWRDVAVWDADSRAAVDVQPYEVVLGLPGARAVTVHRPSTSATPVRRATTASLTVPLDGQVVAVSIR